MSTLIDLSAANSGAIDLGASRDAGLCAAYFRGTLGRVIEWRDTDSRVHAYANEARRATLPFGTYNLLFVRHGRLQDAAQQAEDAVRLAEELGASLPVAVDIETEPGDAQVTEQEALDAIRTWVDRAEALQRGTPPVLYCGPGFWCRSQMRMRATDLARCPLWSSDFEGSREIGGPLATPPWSKAAIHQYAGSPTPTGRVGTFPGIGGYVDLSRMLVPLESLYLP